MAKFVFFTLPTHGSVNPTLAVVHELVDRGHEVVYYVPERFATTVGASGAVVRTYDSRTHTAEMAEHAKDGGMPALMVKEARHVVPQVMDRIRDEAADCLVYGTVYLAARIVSHVLGVPAIALRPTYAANEYSDWFAAMLRERTKQFPNMPDIIARVNHDLAALCTEYGLPEVDTRGAIMHAEQLNIVFLPRAFQIAGDTFDHRYVFVGPSIPPHRRSDVDFPIHRLDRDEPIVYISLGTIVNNQPDFFRICLQALAQQPCSVVLSVGTRVASTDLGSIPDNFIVAPHAPQLEVLARAATFVTHCGMNSTMESLYYGVPMVGVPQTPEEAITAQRLAELGIGRVIEPRDVTVAALRDAVSQVLTEPSYADNARQMQKLALEAGGYQRAADVMVDFVGRHVLA